MEKETHVSFWGGHGRRQGRGGILVLLRRNRSSAGGPGGDKHAGFWQKRPSTHWIPHHFRPGPRTPASPAVFLLYSEVLWSLCLECPYELAHSAFFLMVLFVRHILEPQTRGPWAKAHSQTHLFGLHSVGLAGYILKWGHLNKNLEVWHLLKSGKTWGHGAQILQGNSLYKATAVLAFSCQLGLATWRPWVL